MLEVEREDIPDTVKTTKAKTDGLLNDEERQIEDDNLDRT
jgi:hypothetical protein